MTSADLVALLVEATVATSGAIVLVLALRRPLRRHFGAGAGYGLWALVPTALVAVLLPAATIAPDPWPSVRVIGAMDVQALAMASAPPIDIAQWSSAIWLLGVVAVALRFARQQRAFRRALGTLHPCGAGQFRADAIAGLPAAIGLRRPVIVLPADFEARYTPEQRALMQAHERSHIQRGDLHLNALVVVLRCLFWFNPLLQFAARCFRHDQELACDQRVIARHPQSRRAYGDAMVNTQLAAQPLPLGCHWGPTHPLKERIAMLKAPIPSPARWIGGSAIVLALALFAGVGAWAAQPKNVADTGDIPADAPAAPKSDRESRPAQPPRYPPAALKQGVSGKVVLLVDIDAQGNPTAIEVERAEPAGVFDQAAIDAVWHWTFAPAIESGKQVASRVRVPVAFEADGTPPGEGPREPEKG